MLFMFILLFQWHISLFRLYKDFRINQITPNMKCIKNDMETMFTLFNICKY